MYWNNDIELSFLNSLNSWRRFLLEKLLFPHVVKKFTVFYGTWWLTILFTWPSYFPSTAPDHTRPPPPIICLEDPFKFRLPNHACFFQVVSFPWVSQRKICMHPSFFSFLNIPWLTHFYWFYHSQNSVRSENNEALVIMQFSPIPSYLLPLLPKYLPSHLIVKNPQPTLCNK